MYIYIGNIIILLAGTKEYIRFKIQPGPVAKNATPTKKRTTWLRPVTNRHEQRCVGQNKEGCVGQHEPKVVLASLSNVELASMNNALSKMFFSYNNNVVTTLFSHHCCNNLLYSRATS